MTGTVDIVEIEHTDDAALQSHIDFELERDSLAEGRTLEAVRRRLDVVDAALILDARRAGKRVAVGAIYAAPHEPRSPLLAMSVTGDDVTLPTAGQSLYDTMRAWALRRTSQPRLTVRVDETNTALRRFWDERGFTVAQRFAALRIDLAAGRIEPLSTAIRSVSLAERPDLMRAAWLLQGRSWKDVPGNEQAMPTFERWSMSFRSGRRPPEGTFVALDEAGDVLGLTTTSLTAGDMRVAHTGYTGVDPVARGRGVASALKRRQVEWCRVAGYDALETVNHEDNAAMLAVNERLGFQPYCTVLEFEQHLR